MLACERTSKVQSRYRSRHLTFPNHPLAITEQNTVQLLASETAADQEPVSKRKRLQEEQKEVVASHEDVYDLMEYWIFEGHWPEGFAHRSSVMNALADLTPTDASDNSRKKLKRTASYFQSVKDGSAPEPSTAEYEKTMAKKDLEMDTDKGVAVVSDVSKELCVRLQMITRKAITPTVFPQTALSKA